ncbi:MAG: IS1182 family transposase [Nanoarchaeota archaeon]|jgi:transposase|nr:IS1182 family transposase [Nanoarchaeota archaeon]
MVYIKSNPEQTFLLPTDLRAKIAKDHICFLIEEVVNQLDFTKFNEAVVGAGNPTYHPRINMKIILNGICDRITSTRHLERQTQENIVFMYLSENLKPNFHTIAMFRKNNSELIKQCFLQTIEVAKQLDMVNFSKLYLDGIKVKANASKNKNFNEEEIKFLFQFVDKHLEKMDEVEKEELNEDSVKIPEHLTNKRKLKDKIKEVMGNMDKAKVQLEKAKEKIKTEGAKRVNLTDMDSKLMKMKRGIHYEQGYNCQLLVEDKSEIIVGNYLSDSPVDITETKPTMEKFKEEQKIDLKGVEMFQDNGYSRSKTAEYYKGEGVIAYIPDQVTTKEFHGKAGNVSEFDNDRFELDFEKNQVICPAGHRMDFVKRIVSARNKENWTNVYQTRECNDCSLQEKCAKGRSGYPYREARINPLMRKIRLRLKTKEGIEKYNKRFHKGEVAQAHIEHNLGYREFKCRSQASCENEVNLFSIAYNLKKIQIYIRKNKNIEEEYEIIINFLIPQFIVTQPERSG